MKHRLVYIHAASHSGSTLLARLLARHPEVATVGELSGTPHRARPGYRCSCGSELDQCRFWRRVSEAMARRGFAYHASTAQTDVRNAPHPLVRRPLRPMHRGPLLEMARDLALALLPAGRAHLERDRALKTALVASILECCGKRVLVDSTKSGINLKYHLRNPGLDVKVLWLVRDGRGVALSIARNQGASLERGAYEWRRRNEEAAAIVSRLDPSRWIQVHYEALCARPEQTLGRLWRFIGVEPVRLEGAPPEQHVLGHGSRLKGAEQIRASEKWREELGAGEMRTFDAVAGLMRRRLSYQ